MAETGAGVASAGAEGGEVDSEKAELQRQMEEARERVAQTVTEIKDTVTDQYESVKQSVADTFDWREQFKRHPVEWSLGALVVGLAVGYKIADALEDTEALGRLQDALEPAVERVTGGLSDVADWVAGQLPKLEDVVVPALVAAATPVLADQLKNLFGVELEDIFPGSGGKKKGKSGKGKKGGAKKAKRKGKKGKNRDE